MTESRRATHTVYIYTLYVCVEYTVAHETIAHTNHDDDTEMFSVRSKAFHKVAVAVVVDLFISLSPFPA